MDKNAIREAGLRYRISLLEAEYIRRNTDISLHLKQLIATLPGPYLTYTALLPGEINPANAFIDKQAYFIEPSKDARMEYPPFSTIIVPMVAGDVNGNRIGMGGGWFDRFLSSHPDVTIVGCCYDEMVFTSVPYENHDIKVRYICTETTVMACHIE